MEEKNNPFYFQCTNSFYFRTIIRVIYPLILIFPFPHETQFPPSPPPLHTSSGSLIVYKFPANAFK